MTIANGIDRRNSHFIPLGNRKRHDSQEFLLRKCHRLTRSVQFATLIRMICRMENIIQNYAWGSVTEMPRLLGLGGGTDKPKAELWMGAHPKAPSQVVCAGIKQSLPELIDTEPEHILGKKVAEKYGTLPFLFKVLTAAKSLSIQAHPNLEQAGKGYEEENKAGIPIDAPNRNYRDPNHKPELICALTSFLALRGFRPVEEIINNFPSNLFPYLKEPLRRLESDQSSEALSMFFKKIMESPGDVREKLTSAAVKMSRNVDDVTGRIIKKIAYDYPGNIGILGPLFLNALELNPGEAMFLDAGELHAYIQGGGIEIMANSDNVLRGGNTAKHIDVPELMNVLTFRTGKPRILHPVAEPSGCGKFFQTPAPEFRLAFLELTREGCTLRSSSPEILLCTEGEGRAAASDSSKETFKRGESLFIPASEGEYTLNGHGKVFRAAAGIMENQ